MHEFIVSVAPSMASGVFSGVIISQVTLCGWRAGSAPDRRGGPRRAAGRFRRPVIDGTLVSYPFSRPSKLFNHRHRSLRWSKN